VGTSKLIILPSLCLIRPLTGLSFTIKIHKLTLVVVVKFSLNILTVKFRMPSLLEMELYLQPVVVT
jgi:hypothetical protein